MNMLAGAKYLEAGKPVTVDPNGGLLDSAAPMTFLPGFNIEGYPNRDSTVYGELYGIPEAHTILRGTLRYRGYTDALRGLVRLGLLNPDPHPALHEHVSTKMTRICTDLLEKKFLSKPSYQKSHSRKSVTDSEKLKIYVVRRKKGK